MTENCSVADPHHFYAALSPASGLKKCDAAPAQTLMRSRTEFFTKQKLHKDGIIIFKNCGKC
jgi:hypothetical protein